MGLQAWSGGLVPSASQIFCLEEDRGRTGWAVQSLTTLHGAVLAAGQQGRGEAGGHGLSTNSPSPTPTPTQTRPRRGGRMWVRRCGCGHGHGPGHGQGCGLSGLRRAPGVEPTDTGRWGPGAHPDSESGGRNMISKAMIAHADSRTPCAIQPSMAAVAKCSDPSLGPEMSVAAGNWPAAFEWVPTRSRMTARSTQSLICPMGRDRPRFRASPPIPSDPASGRVPLHMSGLLGPACLARRKHQ